MKKLALLSVLLVTSSTFVFAAEDECQQGTDVQKTQEVSKSDKEAQSLNSKVGGEQDIYGKASSTAKSE